MTEPGKSSVAPHQGWLDEMKRVRVLRAGIVAGLVCSSLFACAYRGTPPAASGPVDSGPPALVLGEFQDDYGNSFTVSAEVWIQHPHGRYTVDRWVPKRQYMIARNPDGEWARIDWLELDGAEPWTWGFCLSAWNADSPKAAEAVEVVDREDPRTGCNGWPFSRMRLVGAP